MIFFHTIQCTICSYCAHEQLLITMQSITFQLVLATDYVSTYGFYIYETSNLDTHRRVWQKIVIGYDTKYLTRYRNLHLPNDHYLIIDRVPGNTALSLPGQWYFNFTSEDNSVLQKLCHQWVLEQELLETLNFQSELACPCTYLQATSDWRFKFGYNEGLSRNSHCATLLFSGHKQNTVECCYDSDGSLIVGSKHGGSVLLYNPLMYYHNYIEEDRNPYQYCCIDSNLCNLYHKFRPSKGCRDYCSPKTCKLIKNNSQIFDVPLLSYYIPHVNQSVFHRVHTWKLTL